MTFWKILFAGVVVMFCVRPSTADVSFLMDQTTYLNGEIPKYIITGAPAGSKIFWASEKNGVASGEGNYTANQGDFYGQVVGSNGIWSGYGGPWSASSDGAWSKKAVLEDAHGKVLATAEAHFTVVPTLTPAKSAPVTQMLGVANWGGQFTADPQSSLTTGARDISSLGAKNIMLAMTPNFNAQDYPGVNFGKVSTLTSLAKSAPFQQVFSMPYQTYAIDAMPLSDPNYLQNTDTAKAYQEMYDLSYYLLTTYKGTGKTFILKNWEGDNALQGAAVNGVVTPQEIQNMRAWLNARDQAVADARKAANVSGVQVLDAVEFNSLDDPRRE